MTELEAALLIVESEKVNRAFFDAKEILLDAPERKQYDTSISTAARVLAKEVRRLQTEKQKT